MNKYDKMTTEDFDRILREKLSEKRADELLSISGVYELVAEDFNNEVLETWELEQSELEGDHE